MMFLVLSLSMLYGSSTVWMDSVETCSAHERTKFIPGCFVKTSFKWWLRHFNRLHMDVFFGHYMCFNFLQKFRIAPSQQYIALDEYSLKMDAIYRGSPTYTKITNTVSTTTVFGLCTYVQVGDFCVSRGLTTVPLTRISCNTVFSKMRVRWGPGLYSPDLSKCYFLQIHTKICSKVPIFYFNRPKRLPDNCCVTRLLREKSALISVLYPDKQKSFIFKYNIKCTMYQG